MEEKTQSLFIDGRWTGASGGKTFTVRNPATGESLAQVSDAGREDVTRAIDAATRAFPAWSQLPARERGAILLKARDGILARQRELARLIAQEGGKPVTEALGEIMYAADFLGFFAEEAKRVAGEVLTPHVAGKRLWTRRRPVGVAGLITIWNFPCAGITRPLGAALAAGCTAVVKPPEQTPLSAARVFAILEESGLPPGVANLVTTEDPRPVGREFVEHPAVRKVNFTGSAEVGTQLLRACAGQVKRVTLELGGHAPLIVFADADVEAAARGALLSKFRNSGQTCVAANRIYVHESIHDAFTTRFVELVRGLRMGNPLDETVQVGSLIDEAAVRKVQAHVDDAVVRGARLLLGGRCRTDGDFAAGHFFEPTVLANVTPAMRIMQEETFGPVAPLLSFRTDDEVIAAANALPWGLAAFFFTRDLNRAVTVGERLEYGIVGVNDALPGAAHVPFGGIKQSGLGKEGGRSGLEEFLDTQLFSLAL